MTSYIEAHKLNNPLEDKKILLEHAYRDPFNEKEAGQLDFVIQYDRFALQTRYFLE